MHLEKNNTLFSKIDHVYEQPVSVYTHALIHFTSQNGNLRERCICCLWFHAPIYEYLRWKCKKFNVLDLKGSTDFENHAVVGLEKTKLLKWSQFSPFLLSPTTQLLSYTLSLDYIQHFCTPVLWRVLASITLECSSPFNIGEDRTRSSKHRPNTPYLWILSHFPCSWLEPITACCVYTAWGNLQLFAFKYHFCHLLPMWFGLILIPQFLYL